jgi:predicted membrane protein
MENYTKAGWMWLLGIPCGILVTIFLLGPLIRVITGDAFSRIPLLVAWAICVISLLLSGYFFAKATYTSKKYLYIFLSLLNIILILALSYYALVIYYFD